MKTILLITAFSINSAFGACLIKAQVKKANATTYYVDGVSISKKIREALTTQCKFEVSTMTNAQIIEMAEKIHAKKMAKLKGLK